MKNGSINVEDLGVDLDSSLTEKEFINSIIGAQASPIVLNGEFHSYYSGTHLVGGENVVLGFYFESGILNSIRISLVDDQLSSWDDFTEETLDIMYENNMKWLNEKFGLAPGTFPWGILDVTYDKKSGNSEIVMKYNRSSGDEK